jgi:signal transduction histidine kinase
MAIDVARLHEEAQRADKAQEEMLMALSRQLLAPLSLIMRAAEIQMATAPESPAGQSFRELAETCHRAAQQMSRVIGDLTAASETKAASECEVDELRAAAR